MISASHSVVVIQLLNHGWLFATPWTAAHQASLPFTVSRSLLKLRSIESVRPSNYLILCRPLLLPPSIFPSIRVFSNESALYIRWPKDWSFSISPSNEYSGLIFFRIAWFDLLEGQGTLKRLIQHHSYKASILQHSAFLTGRICLQFMKPRFDSWFGKICWRRDRLPSLVLWPGESHGPHSPWGHKKSDTTKRLLLSLFSFL